MDQKQIRPDLLTKERSEETCLCVWPYVAEWNT